MKQKKIIIGVLGIVLIIGGGTFGIIHHSYAKNHIRIQRVQHKRPMKKVLRNKGHKQKNRNNDQQNISRKQRDNKPRIQYSMNPSNWSKGTPPALHHSSWWVTNYINYKNKGKYRYIRYSTNFSKTSGFNPIASYYDIYHKYVFGTNGIGASASIHPYYQSLGHGFYRIVSGNVHTHGLKDDLHATKNKTYGEAILVKVNGINDINIWVYKNGKPNDRSKKYLGEFQRYSFSMKELEHVLKIKD